ncbi:hypothetical protein FD755_024579 [Muntiacus reevesi]|uniref:Amine oxidase n=1 Tax=Muntiacus reevesi TaxID=9886 RepID=A0A5N3UW19_MUNRE|nr:hypothetical protein FD755_024579 [Muntiacus reevesi]
MFIFIFLKESGNNVIPACLPPPLQIPQVQTWTQPDQSQLFADLCQEELMSSQPSDNCVFSVELQLPPKAAAPAHLGRESPPPPRMLETALVFRCMSTMLNSDHVWDMVFYPSGAIEVKFHATAYISSAFNFGAARRYGNEVGEHTLGTIHTHSAHYKMDLDVGGKTPQGRGGSRGHTQSGLLFGPQSEVRCKQSPEWAGQLPDQASLLPSPFAAPPPRTGELAEKLRSMGLAPFHDDQAAGQGQYQLVVTQRKETEPSSTSIFNQNDPWTPTVDFADFINNETIAGKSGFLHIPHSEDITNTVTVGNSVGFFLRPYNFFDEDPSINSADSIYFQKNQDAGSCEVNSLNCLPQAVVCAPDLPAFSHGDFFYN